jgi:hypothetical protein
MGRSQYSSVCGAVDNNIVEVELDLRGSLQAVRRSAEAVSFLLVVQ